MKEREWPRLVTKDWAAVDKRRREDADYDVGTTVQAQAIADAAVAAASVAPFDASYVTLGTNSTLTAERVLTAGNGITLTDGGAGGTLTVATGDYWLIKSGDTSRANTATPSPDPDLQASLATGVYWVMIRTLYTSTSATPDITLQVAFPASSYIIGTYTNSANGLTYLAQDSTTPGPAVSPAVTANVVGLTLFDVMVSIGTAGTLSVDWSQTTSNATATTMKAGSFLRYRKLT